MGGSVTAYWMGFLESREGRRLSALGCGRREGVGAALHLIVGWKEGAAPLIAIAVRLGYTVLRLLGRYLYTEAVSVIDPGRALSPGSEFRRLRRPKAQIIIIIIIGVQAWGLAS